MGGNLLSRVNFPSEAGSILFESLPGRPGSRGNPRIRPNLAPVRRGAVTKSGRDNSFGRAMAGRLHGRAQWRL